MPPVQGVLGVLKEPALGGVSHFGVGLDVRDLEVFRVREVSGERLVKRIRRGALFARPRVLVCLSSDDAAAPATPC